MSKSHLWVDATPAGIEGWFREVRRCIRCGKLDESKRLGAR